MLPQNDNRGYSDWLKNENPEENVYNHKELYTKRKQELREQYALSTNKIQAPSFYSSSGSSLLDQSNDYTSGLFDPMQYTDLKKSYIETIIPVSEEDYTQMPSYRTIDEYKRARDFNTKNPDLYRDHKNILDNNEEEDRKMSNYRAYELARQLEASEHKNRMFASQFYKILN
jgi:activator of 2-hydroxyglutaryl-CoA dehydratase